MSREPHHRVAPSLAGGVLLALAMLVLAACGSSAAPSPSSAPSESLPIALPSAMATTTATPPPTATATPAPSASEAASSVHIDLPKGWQQVQLTAAALNAQIKAVQASNPDLAASYQQLLDSGAFKGFLFYALDFEKLSNTGNVNVTVVQAGGISLDAVQPLIEGEFKQLGASKITFRHATVRGVDSLVVDYLLTLKSPGGSRAMTARAYFIPNADVLYNVTTTCYGTTPQTCIADGDAMAQGMTVTR